MTQPGQLEDPTIQQHHPGQQQQQLSGEGTFGHQPIPLAWGKISMAPLLGVPGNEVGVYEQYLTLNAYKHSAYPPIRQLSQLKKGSYQPPQIYANPLNVPEHQRHTWSQQSEGHALRQDATMGSEQEGQWLDRSFCNHHHTDYFDQEMCRAHTDPLLTGEMANIQLQAYCLVRVTRTDPGQAELTARELNIQPIVIPYGSSVVDIPNLQNIMEQGKRQQLGHLQEQEWQQQQPQFQQQARIQQQQVQQQPQFQQKPVQQQPQLQQQPTQQQRQQQIIQEKRVTEWHVPQQQQQQTMTHGLDTRKEEHLVSGSALEQQDFRKDLPISKSSYEKKVEDPMYYTPSQEASQKTYDAGPSSTLYNKQVGWTDTQSKDVRGMNVGGSGGAAGMTGAAGVAGVAAGAMGTTTLQGQNLTNRVTPNIAGPISSGQKGLKGSNVFYQDVTNVGPTTFGQQVEIVGDKAAVLPAKAPYSDSAILHGKHTFSMEPGTKVPTSYTAASASMLPGALSSTYLDEKHRLMGEAPVEQDPTSVHDYFGSEQLAKNQQRVLQYQKATRGIDRKFATVDEKGFPVSGTSTAEKVTPFQPPVGGSAERVLYPPVKVAAAKDTSSWSSSPTFGLTQEAGLGGGLLSPYSMSDISDKKYNDPNAWLDRVELAMKYAKSYNIQVAP